MPTKNKIKATVSHCSIFSIIYVMTIQFISTACVTFMYAFSIGFIVLDVAAFSIGFIITDPCFHWTAECRTRG